MKALNKIFAKPAEPTESQDLVLNTAMAIAGDILNKELDKSYEPISHPLVDKLIKLREEIRSTYRHDEISQWTSEGFGIFIDILRKDYPDLSGFSEVVLFGMVRFLGVQYGGFYIFNDDAEPKNLELFACFSLNKKRYNPKSFLVGEGIVGQAFMDGDKIYFTDIPETGLRIASTMLQIKPKAILAVPLKNDFGKYGVIELASIKEFEPYEIAFVEELSKNIATALSSTKNSIQTKRLLETTTSQAHALQQQEEELRMNLEELISTQEEMQRKQNELEKIKSELEANQIELKEALNTTRLNEIELKIKNEELQAQEEEMRQNLEELLTTQEEMRKKQTEQLALQQVLQQSEARLKEELDRSKITELELKRKAHELETKDLELLEMISRMQAQQDELNQVIAKMESRELVLKKSVLKYKDTLRALNEKDESIENYKKIISQQNLTIESLKDEINNLKQRL